ncbi:MAG: TetR family transcriptional regulator [Anaerolineales bacterium]|nr:TetR family transcriptional regulator [Anaerolineales bacterium]
MSIRKRAISNEQKGVRRQQILDAALQLFHETSYDAVSMAGVAAQAGVAKGTLYLYFKTKEALFLALQMQEFVDWFDEIDRVVGSENGRFSTSIFLNIIGRSLESRPTFTRLIAILHTVLEHNISYEEARQFKQMLRDRVYQTGALLEAKLDFLEAGQGTQLLLQIYALVIGFQHLANPAPIIVETIAADETLTLFDIDFLPAFLNTLQTILQGLIA